MKRNIELLAPAGSYEGFEAALGAGADAVYVGGSMFGARAYAQNFTQEELLKAQEEGHDLVVLDMPLLLEISWQLRVEEVWIVKVPLEMQIERVTLRDGFTREQVLDRIHKQMPTDNKLNYADVIIDNSRSVEDTRRQVREALAKAKERMRDVGD